MKFQGLDVLKFISIFAFAVSPALSSAQITKSQSSEQAQLTGHFRTNSTHTLDLRIILFKNSRWTKTALKENLNETKQIYSQCGIELGHIDFIESSENIEEIYFDIEGYTDPQEKHHESGALQFAKKYAVPGKANILFFERFDPEYGHIPATAVPLTRIKQDDQKVALNTVWMPYLAEINRLTDESDGGHREGFNTLAHEIGHLLLDDSHVSLPREYNLMHEMRSNLNGRLTLKQCETMRNSVLLKRIQNNEISVCPQIRSPLVRELFVSDYNSDSANSVSTNERNSCLKISNLVNELEKTQDLISDLLPASGADFYFTTQGNEISHLDRNSFSANLSLTYDMHGKIKLPYQQERILWIHELGHAVLNQQLQNDWDWFKKRIEIYRTWGNAITASSSIERKLKNENSEAVQNQLKIQVEKISQITNALLKDIHNYPNAYEYEEILGPYHEMFADAFVLLATSNAKSLKFGLSNPQDPTGRSLTPEEKEELDDRDYSYLRDPNTWNKSEVHNMLTPFLAHWWKQASSTPDLVHNRPQLLRRLYETILNEIKIRTTNPNLRRISPAEANNRLIKNFSGFSN